MIVARTNGCGSHLWLANQALPEDHSHPQHQPSIATLTKHIAICTSSPCLQPCEIYLSIKFYLYVPPLATAHTPFVVSHLHPVGPTTTIAIFPISSYTPLYISLPRPRMDQTPSIARDSGLLELWTKRRPYHHTHSNRPHAD
jgi:hypothetical protein